MFKHKVSRSQGRAIMKQTVSKATVSRQLASLLRMDVDQVREREPLAS